MPFKIEMVFVCWPEWLQSTNCHHPTAEEERGAGVYSELYPITRRWDESPLVFISKIIAQVTVIKLQNRFEEEVKTDSSQRTNKADILRTRSRLFYSGGGWMKWPAECCYTWAFDESAPLPLSQTTIADRLLEPTSTHTLSFTFLPVDDDDGDCVSGQNPNCIRLGFWTMRRRTRRRRLTHKTAEARITVCPGGERSVSTYFWRKEAYNHRVFIYMLIDRRIFNFVFFYYFF